MIRQVRLKEISTDAAGLTTTRRVFAFGKHNLALSTDYPLGDMATATATEQSIRVIMDELLVGNYLEEIACRGLIDNDAYDYVPIGATPDDIAKCAVARDVLPESCKGEKTVCMCQLASGCGDAALGEPVGVLDVNQDGAADDTRFIGGAVGIKCNDTINVPIDVDMTYWNPSGDQNRPAMGGFEALGPAVVLNPNGPLPTNTTCQLAFAPDVVDKQGNRVCAPPGGDVELPCPGPDDTSAFKFKVQPLTVTNQNFDSGATGVSRTDFVTLALTAPIAAASLSAITVTQNGAPYTAFTVSNPQPKTIRITWTATGGLAANTTYAITVSVQLTDTFSQPLPTPVTYTFTTGA